LTQNYLLDEAQSGKLTETTKTADGEDLMSGWTVEDFLGPEMAKTSK
jgi:hypothetical protein